MEIIKFPNESANELKLLIESIYPRYALLCKPICDYVRLIRINNILSELHGTLKLIGNCADCKKKMTKGDYLLMMYLNKSIDALNEFSNRFKKNEEEESINLIIKSYHNLISTDVRLNVFTQLSQNESNWAIRYYRTQKGSRYYKTCLEMQDSEFKKYFRMSKEILGNRFGMGESTTGYVLRDVVNAINKRFLKEKIRLPVNESECLEISDGFSKVADFPGIFGIIGCSHIKIKSPSTFATNYYNHQKNHYSIIIQAVVDDKKKFIDMSVGYPGSTQDNIVGSNNIIDDDKIISSNSSGNNLSQFYLLGDVGYPNLNWMLTPYNDDDQGTILTREESYYNLCHSHTRKKIEQSYGLLKSRWKCLNITFEASIEFVALIVSACCILHNLCEERKEFLPPCEIFSDNEKVEFTRNNIRSEAGILKRDKIKNHLWFTRTNNETENFTNYY
nr:15927_t:CDS:2 [Entrophospora candida]